MVNRSKRAIEFELVDTQDLGTGRLEAKGVRYVPALPTTLGPRESIMVEVNVSSTRGGGGASSRSSNLPFEIDRFTAFTRGSLNNRDAGN